MARFCSSAQHRLVLFDRKLNISNCGIDLGFLNPLAFDHEVTADFAAEQKVGQFFISLGLRQFVIVQVREASLVDLLLSQQVRDLAVLGKIKSLLRTFVLLSGDLIPFRRSEALQNRE